MKFISINIPNSKIKEDFNKEALLKTSLSENEKMYSNIVRSYLNNELLQLLSINCYCDKNNHFYPEYNALLHRYQFLEHMRFIDHDKDDISTLAKNRNNLMIQIYKSYEKATFGKSTYIKDCDWFIEQYKHKKSEIELQIKRNNTNYNPLADNHSQPDK